GSTASKARSRIRARGTGRLRRRWRRRCPLCALRRAVRALPQPGGYDLRRQAPVRDALRLRRACRNAAMRKAPVAPPATFVIFGATGDLTRRLLMPALVNLEAAKLLDAKTSFIGVSHGEGDDAGLRKQLSAFVEDSRVWQRLAKRIHYLQGD